MKKLHYVPPFPLPVKAEFSPAVYALIRRYKIPASRELTRLAIKSAGAPLDETRAGQKKRPTAGGFLFPRRGFFGRSSSSTETTVGRGQWALPRAQGDPGVGGISLRELTIVFAPQSRVISLAERLAHFHISVLLRRPAFAAAARSRKAPRDSRLPTVCILATKDFSFVRACCCCLLDCRKGVVIEYVGNYRNIAIVVCLAVVGSVRNIANNKNIIGCLN